MKDDSQSRHKARIEAWAREYTGMGYSVIVEPGPADLPDFLRPFRPDIIARSPKESIVAEVKSRPTLGRSKQLAELARALEGRPGWRLDLLVTNPRGETSVPDDTDVADIETVQARLQTAQRLGEEGQLEAAMLLAWSAVEGVLRNMAEEEGVYLGRRGPSYLTKQLYSLGFLSRNEYLQLDEGLSYRNSLIHGFTARGLRISTIVALINLARTFLAHSPG